MRNASHAARPSSRASPARPRPTTTQDAGLHLARPSLGGRRAPGARAAFEKASGPAINLLRLRAATTIPGAGFRLAWPSIRRPKTPDAEAALMAALEAGDGPAVDLALDALLLQSAPAAPPRLDPAPWVVAHTRGPLTWRAFSGQRALASQAIDMGAASVVSRAEAFGGRILSTAVGTVETRAGDPATWSTS